MILHNQKKIIHFTLTNMLSFEKNSEEKKEDVKIKHLRNGTIMNQFHCGIC